MLKTNKTVDGIPVSGLSHGSDKRVALVCDGCGKTSHTTWANYYRSSRIRKSRKTYCRKCSNKRSGLKKRGKEIKKTGPRPKMHGPKHPSWKGGRYIASDGYVQVYLGPRQYRKEHFLVVERHIGRKLSRVEVVHHIDTDKQNNGLKNLVLLANESEHQKAHASLRSVAARIIKAGLIWFSRETNTYMAVGKLRELLGRLEEANQQPSQGSDTLEGSTTRYESL